MKKLLLIALLLSGGIPAYSATTDQITKALAKYCVPKPNSFYDGVSICGSEFEGIYKKDKVCGCYDNQYLKYDSEKRHCVIKCNPGSNGRLLKANETKGKKCPPGYNPTIEIKR